MADGYARVTGRVGVCEGPSGGGATYILPGLVEANESSIPVLAITSDVPVSSRGRYPLTELDQESLFRPLTKWNTVIDLPSQIPSRFRAAFRAMTTGRPGTAHIGLPYDVQKQDLPADDIWAQAEHRSFPAFRAAPEPQAVTAAAEVILSARFPVFVCGGGVLLSRACPMLVALAEALGAPIWAANCVGRRDDGSQYGSVQNFHGGLGGRSAFDGLDTLSFPSNCRVTAIEMFEVTVPALMERKALIPDSGGAGKYRGGLGQRVILRNLGHSPMSIYLASERVRHPCFGVAGGQAGSAGKVVKNGEPHFPKISLNRGDRLEVETPGGGGWGPAAERPALLIERDLADGLISPEAAKAVYNYDRKAAA